MTNNEAVKHKACVRPTNAPETTNLEVEETIQDTMKENSL